MLHREQPGAEVITIISEPGALTFATRKEWQELPEIFLGEITHHETVMVFYGTSSIFILLRNLDVTEWLKDDYIAFRLVKISIDEDEKQRFYIMNLSKAEGAQLIRNRKTIWE